MSNKGFIVIDRCVEDWQWWGISSAMTLWFYILVKANWKEGFFLGQRVPRGAFCTSIRTISEETDLSESTIKRWLKKFESAGQITVKGTNKYSVISVINYAKYQDRENNVNQQMTEQVNQQVNQQVTEQVNHNRTNKQSNNSNQETNKEEKVSKDTSKKKVELLDDREYWFEEFWKVYPRRVAKQTALKAFSKACKTEADYVAIMSGLRDALPGLMEKDPTYIPHPATWLNQRRWEDEPQPVYIPQPKETLSLAQQLGRLMEESEEDYLLPYDDN